MAEWLPAPGLGSNRYAWALTVLPSLSISQLCDLGQVVFTSLNLSFLFYEMKIITVPVSHDRCVCVFNVLSIVADTE